METFWKRGHREITVFVPQWRQKRDRLTTGTTGVYRPVFTCVLKYFNRVSVCLSFGPLLSWRQPQKSISRLLIVAVGIRFIYSSFTCDKSNRNIQTGCFSRNTETFFSAETLYVTQLKVVSAAVLLEQLFGFSSCGSLRTGTKQTCLVDVCVHFAVIVFTDTSGGVFLQSNTF